jgi:thiamine monophosphate synthase
MSDRSPTDQKGFDVGILKRFVMSVAATGAAGVAVTVGIAASAGWQATTLSVRLV